MDVRHLLRSFLELIRSSARIPNVSMNLVDVIEIILVSMLFYHIILWFKNTRAWNLFKGIMVVLAFVLLATILQMNTILWIAQNTLNIGLIAIVIIFQPELRSALESIGGRDFLKGFLDFSRGESMKFSDKTVDELVKASYAMGRVKTGALMVIEDEITLDDFIRTGIDVDGLVTSQLLINIFEKNTPLHDGAVIIRGDRIVSATCYLPLSDSMDLSKDLGTRHRAAVGVSEVSDSLTIIVSEETGNVSVAYRGRITKAVTPEYLREQLVILQKKHYEENSWDKLKRRFLNERNERKHSDVSQDEPRL